MLLSKFPIKQSVHPTFSNQDSISYNEKGPTPIRQSYESACFNSRYRTIKKKIRACLLEKGSIPDFNFAKIESAGTFKSICTFIYCEREDYTESEEVKVSVFIILKIGV